MGRSSWLPEQKRGLVPLEEEKLKGKSPRSPDPREVALAAEYDAVHQRLLTRKQAFMEEVAKEYTPRLNAKVRVKWEQEKPETHEARQAFIEWIAEHLESLGLALFEPKTRRAAYLMVTGREGYRLVPVGGTSGKTSVDFLELLPLQLTMANSHKQTRIGAHTATKASKSAERTYFR